MWAGGKTSDILDDFRVLNLIIRILLKKSFVSAGEKKYDLKNSIAEPATNVQIEINQLLGYC